MAKDFAKNRHSLVRETHAKDEEENLENIEQEEDESRHEPCLEYSDSRMVLGKHDKSMGQMRRSMT